MRSPVVWALILLPGGAAAQDNDGIEFFEKKIRPVLVDRCYSCHSAEAKKLKGSLFLDTRDGILKGGDLGPSLVPGDPDRSLLIKAIRTSTRTSRCPQGKAFRRSRRGLRRVGEAGRARSAHEARGGEVLRRPRGRPQMVGVPAAARSSDPVSQVSPDRLDCLGTDRG